MQNSFVSKFRNLIYFFLRYHRYFLFIVRCYLLRRTQWIAFSTVKIIYYYKLINMIWSMNDLMIHMLVLRFYKFKILLICIFHSDCRWICRLTTPLLISTISKYHLEIDTLNDPFLWIKSDICAAGENTFTIHSKITDIGEEVVSLHFHPIAFTIVQLKGHRQVFRNESIVAKVSYGCHFSVTVLSVDSEKWLN